VGGDLTGSEPVASARLPVQDFAARGLVSVASSTVAGRRPAPNGPRGGVA